MNQSFNLKTACLAVRNWIALTIPGRGFFVISLALATLAFSPAVCAQCPSLCDFNNNTAEGQSALISLATGLDNTAIGAFALVRNTAGSDNTAIGYDTLYANSTGTGNTAIGSAAMAGTGGVSVTGSYNTAIGIAALASITTGSNNTANGSGALEFNTSGNDNTAIGFHALESNTTATYNTATGYQALQSNNADGNTADGYQALYGNTSGIQNTATGVGALLHNSTASSNTADGYDALLNNTTGNDNTATGDQALVSNTTGNFNTATGLVALESNTTGSNNTANGLGALVSNTTGSSNIALGFAAGSSLTTGNNNIDIGANVFGVAGESNTTRIGKAGKQAATYIAGIYTKGIASATGVNVKIDSTGKLGTVLSSARYKEVIKPMDKASESLLKLEPITFRYKKEFDPDGVTQFGLVAEEVETVCPDLVVRDEEGKPLTVRYDAVNAMLLNEFLKEHRKVQEQGATIAELKKEITSLAATVKEEAAQIHKVSDRVAPTKSPARLVANSR